MVGKVYSSPLHLSAVARHESTCDRLIRETPAGMFTIGGENFSSGDIIGFSGINRDQAQIFRDRLRNRFKVTVAHAGEMNAEVLELETAFKNAGPLAPLIGEVICVPTGATSPEGKPLVDACGFFSRAYNLDLLTSIMRQDTPYSARVDGTHDTTCHKLILVTVLVETLHRGRVIIIPWLCYYAPTENSAHLKAGLDWVCNKMRERESARNKTLWFVPAKIPPPLYVVSDPADALPRGFTKCWPELASRCFRCESHTNKTFSEDFRTENKAVLGSLREMNRANDLPTYLFHARRALLKASAANIEAVLAAIRNHRKAATVARLDLDGLPGAFLSAGASANNDIEGGWHSPLKLWCAVGSDGARVLSSSTSLCTSVERVGDRMESAAVAAAKAEVPVDYPLHGGGKIPGHWRPLLDLFEEGLLRERQAFHMNKALACYAKGVMIAGKLVECVATNGLVCMWTRHANCGVICWCLLARDLYWVHDRIKFLNPPGAMPAGYGPTATFAQVPHLEPNDDGDSVADVDVDAMAVEPAAAPKEVEAEGGKANLNLFHSSATVAVAPCVRAPAAALAVPEIALAGVFLPRDAAAAAGSPAVPRFARPRQAPQTQPRSPPVCGPC
jgi:hypothetical protein